MLVSEESHSANNEFEKEKVLTLVDHNVEPILPVTVPEESHLANNESEREKILTVVDRTFEPILPVELIEQTNYNNLQSETELNRFIDSIFSMSKEN